MRLTCPNCDAQYEVPDEVVPTAGRDVQCSNCGQTWFQHHPDNAPPEEDEETLTVDAPSEDEEVSPPPPPAPPPSVGPERRQLDPAVADILRQEAEAEFEARKRRQSTPLESQPDLGLDTGEPTPPPRPDMDEDDADRRALEAKKRMARMRGEAEPAAEVAATAAAMSSRRELLPDIEEINSTLRNDSNTTGVDADVREGLGAGGQRKKSGGFRRGFISVVLIFVVLALLYIYAPKMSAMVPALEGVMTAYTGFIDQLRISLARGLRALLTWLDVVASQSEG
ncbi:MJ0042 family finger-like domain protein [Sulfitobacter noctilucae]|uniref:zinc-ribbon domain-containing protein n=1 Tax=Sulfitobacter noctilucae TaxID=1342302 RepID=UPI000468C844|nr:zinc-ribbon domain-containing protein [Sulfitobacter noctilucae]KIN60142.1 MJ0042 family finger-like domain protein [Sulfitobacter noctilucae]